MNDIIICSRRNSDADWDDLDLAVRSMLHYSPATVWVFWQQADGGPGPHFDWRDDSAGVRLIAQPDDIDTFGAAYEFATRRVLLDGDRDGVVIANDDVVLRPDTWQLLADDVATLRAGDYQPAAVAARSNYVRACQQTVGPQGDVVETAAVSPLFAWLDADAIRAVTWPHCNWYSDDVLCHDWRQLGYRIFISRAWVHHVGERSTRADGATQHDLDAAGRAWLHRHRPDAADALGVQP